MTKQPNRNRRLRVHEFTATSLIAANAAGFAMLFSSKVTSLLSEIPNLTWASIALIAVAFGLLANGIKEYRIKEGD